MVLPESLAVLRHRDFRVYWIGQAISLAGTWMQVMAQNWVVTTLSPRAWVLGLLTVAGTLPMLALGLKAGELADRLDKRRILLATQVAMMVLAFVFAGLVFAGSLQLWHVFALAVAVGTVAAFDLPAAQAFAPELVDRAQIPRAVAMMQAIFHGGRLVGPALAGVLILQFGTGSAFAANGLSFVAVIVSLMMIKGSRDAAARAGAAGPSTGPGAGGGAGLGAGAPGGAARGGGSFREGIAYVKKDVTSRSLLLLMALAMGLVFPFLAVLMAYYARHVLGADASGMGNLMSASGLGAMVGALTLVIVAPESWRVRLFIGVVGMAGSIVGLAYDRVLWLAAVLVTTLSFSSSMMMGTLFQVVQTRVPPELRGRVMALFGMAFTSVLPFSGMALSVLADLVGYRRLMAASALVFVIAGIAVLLQLGRALAEERAAPTPAA